MSNEFCYITNLPNEIFHLIPFMMHVTRPCGGKTENLNPTEFPEVGENQGIWKVPEPWLYPLLLFKCSSILSSFTLASAHYLDWEEFCQLRVVGDDVTLHQLVAEWCQGGEMWLLAPQALFGTTIHTLYTYLAPTIDWLKQSSCLMFTPILSPNKY